MSRNKTSGAARPDRAPVTRPDRALVTEPEQATVTGPDRALVTAAEWFAGGRRIGYDPEAGRVLTETEAAAAPGALRVFERVAAAEQDAATVWLTLLPGFPDGSYGWAQVDRILGEEPGPRLYVEPVGQGDSDKPRDYPYSRMTPLLARNERFARTYTPAALGIPAAQVLVVTCLDHRVDPAIVLGLQLGDAPVIRNAGGRVTQTVIDDIAFLAFLAEQLFGGRDVADTLFEVAVIHHTQCATGFLADPGFRRQAAEATGLSDAALEASAVTDPHVTVKADVERLLTSPMLPPKVSVSGHVYDIGTGRLATTVDARYPERRGA